MSELFVLSSEGREEISWLTLFLNPRFFCLPFSNLSLPCLQISLAVGNIYKICWWWGFCSGSLFSPAVAPLLISFYLAVLFLFSLHITVPFGSSSFLFYKTSFLSPIKHDSRTSLITETRKSHFFFQLLVFLGLFLVFFGQNEREKRI